MDSRKEPLKGKAAPTEIMINILVDQDYPTPVLKIGSQLSTRVMKELVGFLRMNSDVFALIHSNMCGGDSEPRIAYKSKVHSYETERS